MMNNTENKNFDFLHNISDMSTSLDMLNLQKSIYTNSLLIQALSHVVLNKNLISSEELNTEITKLKESPLYASKFEEIQLYIDKLKSYETELEKYSDDLKWFTDLLK